MFYRASAHTFFLSAHTEQAEEREENVTEFNEESVIGHKGKELTRGAVKISTDELTDGHL